MKHFHPARILVPTDFSEPATTALREAVLLAERFGSQLDVIYADLLLPEVGIDDIFGIGGSVDLERLDRVESQLERYVTLHVPAAVRRSSRVIVDSPVHAVSKRHARRRAISSSWRRTDAAAFAGSSSGRSPSWSCEVLKFPC